MKRRIITIDKDKCDGCGLCIMACHEGALELIDGKATLIKDDYCDGLGDCLPTCPTDAISFEEREAAPYDEAAVLARAAQRGEATADPTASEHVPKPVSCSCPGAQARPLKAQGAPESTKAEDAQGLEDTTPQKNESQLRQWPIQIKLVPSNAPYFDGADVLIAADCTAYAYADFHCDYMKGKITLIACPKLDEGDYTQKLTDIFSDNSLASVTVTRMEVPCCGGLERAVRTALDNSGKNLPLEVVTIASDGTVLS